MGSGLNPKKKKEAPEWGLLVGSGTEGNTLGVPAAECSTFSHLTLVHRRMRAKGSKKNRNDVMRLVFVFCGLWPALEQGADSSPLGDSFLHNVISE